MHIQGFGNIAPPYATTGPMLGKPSATASEPSDAVAGSSTQVSISSQAAALSADAHLAEIGAKDPTTQTAEDIDATQKAGGFVNTMAKLSPAEKKLYDELVAKGGTDAVRGMNLLALSRMGGADVTLPNRKTFDPGKTAITADNVRRLFSQMFAGSDGADAKSLEALASYLDGRPEAST